MRMRMLLAIAGLMTVPALAMAQGTYGDENPQQPGSTGSDVSPGAEERTGMETGQTGQTGQTGTQAQTGSMGQMDPQSQQQIFRSRENFELKGTVASVDATNNTIHVDRKNLPPAELSVADQTKVKVNGRQATLNDLPPGAEIRAKFNLAQDQAVATEVDAKSKGEKTMQKGAREMEKGAREMERGSQEMQNR